MQADGARRGVRPERTERGDEGSWSEEDDEGGWLTRCTGGEGERWDDARPAGSGMWVPPTRPADHPLAGGTRGEADGARMA
ncbi:unnamed protein product [Closterium sp. NIES-65]|nr:unnamed protein product [Closterium sp. NIES-65]